MVITYSKSVDQPGMVANSARGQLNRENESSPSPFAPENLISRDGFDSPVPRQPSSLHTQAESGTYGTGNFLLAPGLYFGSLITRAKPVKYFRNRCYEACWLVGGYLLGFYPFCSQKKEKIDTKKNTSITESRFEKRSKTRSARRISSRSGAWQQHKEHIDHITSRASR